MRKYKPFNSIVLMNKTCLVLLFFFICIGAKGQADEFKPSLGIGFHGNVNLSSVYFIPAIRQKFTQAYSGGFAINYTSERNAGIQLELNYTQRGWKDKYDTLGSYSRTMDYYEIPFLTHVYIGKKLFRLTFELGPYIGFYQGYSESYEYQAPMASDSVILGERTYWGKDIDNKFDYGFIGGGGFSLNTGFGEFLFRVRYVQGLVSIFNKYPEGNFRYTQMQTIQIGFAWMYPIYLKKK